jgi:ADP-ribose pyrophosphatase YjhB (NUDIX family)
MSNYILDLRKIVGHQTIIQCASSIIVADDDNRILLGRRTDNNMLGYFGGSVEIDEKVEDCAKRELYEETGIIADEIEFFCINSGPETHYVYPNGDEVSNIEIIYLCKKYHGELTESDEMKELKYFNVKDIDINDISPPIRSVVQKYMDLIKNS